MQTITDADIFQNPEFATRDTYEKRVTVKAIVENDCGEYAFVSNRVHGFILLPGGGAEGTDLEYEINRECEEELFYSVKNVQELFRVHEFRNRDAQESETVCFRARADKPSPEDTRTKDEKDNGMFVVWLTKEEAMKRLSAQKQKVANGEVRFYNTAFNIVRDYLFFSRFVDAQ